MNEPIKFTLRHIRMNAQGYTSSGEYYGRGARLYWYCSDDCQHDGKLRANNRSHAKALVRAIYKGAKFYN